MAVVAVFKGCSTEIDWQIFWISFGDRLSRSVCFFLISGLWSAARTAISNSMYRSSISNVEFQRVLQSIINILDFESEGDCWSCTCFCFNAWAAKLLLWKYVTILLTRASTLLSPVASRDFWAARFKWCAKQPRWGSSPDSATPPTMFGALSVTTAFMECSRIVFHLLAVSYSASPICSAVWDSGVWRVSSTLSSNVHLSVIKCAVTVVYDIVARLDHPSVVKETAQAFWTSLLTRSRTSL